MSAHTTGCGDNSCVFRVLRTGSGMATNGGCRCFSALVSWNEAVQQDVQRLVVELRRARTSKADLLEALKGEASVIDGKLCWCGMPNMVPYRGHDSGCEYNRELVAKAEGES